MKKNLYVWLPTRTNNKNLTIGIKKKFGNLANFWTIFFMENPSYRSKSYFSGRGFGENSAVKETLAQIEINERSKYPISHAFIGITKSATP
jgi:hypothetical protein